MKSQVVESLLSQLGIDPEYAQLYDLTEGQLEALRSDLDAESIEYVDDVVGKRWAVAITTDDGIWCIQGDIVNG